MSNRPPESPAIPEGRRQRPPATTFYLIPEATFKKLRLRVAAAVAWDYAGEPLWDLLENDIGEKFDDDDLAAVRFSNHDPLDRDQLKKLGSLSVEIL